MAIFQVSSRKSLTTSQLQQSHTARFNRWRVTVRVFISVTIVSILTAMVITKKWYEFLILLPVGLTIAFSPALFRKITRGTLTYGFFTLCLLTIYSTIITAFQLLIHNPISTPEILIVTSTLGCAAVLDPTRLRIQRFIEQRFNVQNYEKSQAIELFTSTLREEIDLDQLRNRLFSVILETMQPQLVSLWVRKVVQQEVDSQPYAEVNVADTDPIIVYALNHPGAMEIERINLSSPVLQRLQKSRLKIVLPLGSQGELIGLLNLGPRLDGEEYTREDRTLLTMLAAQVAPALRVAQMVYERQAQVRENERIEQEMRTAQDIQQTFLPKEIPTLPGWHLAPYYHPAREVGGDFYDFIPFEDGRLGLVIGDVTDKGIPAALVMTATRTMLRTAAQQQSSPGEVLACVNELLYEDIPAKMFVTCFYAILTIESGHLHYANAGHEPPFRHSSGSACELEATGMPLGMMPGTRYDEYETTLAPGEQLLFYSDGLVEAHNGQRDMFGFPRLTACIADYPGDSQLIDYLLQKLVLFTGSGWEQEDDVTMVVLQRLPL